MKKKIFLVISAVVLCFVLSGCKETKIIKEPDVTQIRSICNLATLECKYHNVAKLDKEGDFFLQKDRKLWIEYTGVAKIGIDMSEVDMKVKGDKITVTLPDAKLLNVRVDENSWNKEAHFISGDGLIKNKITAEDQTNAIAAGQREMENSVKNNKALLISARDRAQKLIENYIKKLGEISDIDYQIKWVYEETAETDNEEKAKN